MTIPLFIQSIVLSLAALPLPGAPSNVDQAFLQAAFQTTHEQTAQASAHSMDSNLRVRWYAQKLAKDCGAIESALRSFAGANGVRLAAVQARNVRPFFANDGVWVEMQIAKQRAVTAQFEKEVETTHDTRFRKLTETLLPLLRQDLQAAEEVFASIPQRAVAAVPKV